jgi:hypothetical protein
MNAYLCSYVVKYTQAAGVPREFQINNQRWDTVHPESLPRLIVQLWQLVKWTPDIIIENLTINPLRGAAC